MKIVILGAGLSGCVASAMLKAYFPTVLEKRKAQPALNDHKAVMRIKDPALALLLGSSVKKIKVHKAIWSKGQLRNYSTIRDNNLYSLKTSGFIGNKSIIRTKDAERYLLQNSIQPQCTVINECEITRVEEGAVYTKNSKLPFPYDFCISTLPMPTICKLTETNFHEVEFKTSEITVLHYFLDIDTTDSYQTIYYPDEDLLLYRASLQEGKIIAEVIGTSYNNQEIEKIETTLADSFGVKIRPETIAVPMDIFIQENGKMYKIDERKRKEIIYNLTNKLNIFSLGRYAIWKPIRADDLLKDISVIVDLMKSREKYLFLHKQRKSHES